MNHDHEDDTRPTFETLLTRAKLEGLLRLLSEPVILCSSCLLPCAACDGGCSTNLDDAARAA